MQLDGSAGVDLYFPASGQEYVERLRTSTAGHAGLRVREHPVEGDGLVDTWPALELHTAALDHRIDTYGWRLQEPDGRRMLPERPRARGIAGPDVGRLQAAGTLDLGGQVVRLEDVSELRPGQSFGFVLLPAAP